MTLLELLRHVLGRVVWIREEYDPVVRDQALEDLEADLAGWLGRVDVQAQQVAPGHSAGVPTPSTGRAA